MAQPAVRPYQPVTPANNKYLDKRWDQEFFNFHRKKVAAAKAMIDNMPPTVHMHLHIKLKKLQFEAERLATIERDNRILLEKIAHIMRNGGLVDHKKLDYTHKSLNKTKRQRELLRITHENLAILKRLTTKDPHYNHKKWLLEWQVNQQYLMNISKYPHPWRQEQSPYITQTERQSRANKRINKKVKSKAVTSTSDRMSSLGGTTPVTKEMLDDANSRETDSRASEITTTVTTLKLNDNTRLTPEVPFITVVDDDAVTNTSKESIAHTIHKETVVPTFEVTSEDVKKEEIIDNHDVDKKNEIS